MANKKTIINVVNKLKANNLNDMIYYILVICLLLIIVYTIYFAISFCKRINVMEKFVEKKAKHNAINKKKIVYLKIDTCGFCVKFTPVYEECMKSRELSKQYVFSEPMSISKGNTDAEKYAEKYNVRAFPTVLVFNSDGSLWKQHSGYMTVERFKEFLLSS